MRFLCTFLYFTHQWECLWENVVSDIVSSNTELLQVDWISVLESHLDRLQMSVHCNINSGNCSLDLNKVVSEIFRNVFE